ncbi:PilZ domain-containing protein [Gracilibacillus ureilyticus]|uniref:PilZ domain-containing protein n=1 Tax=Gracilibacillus ureilyticus TaxID=531814 RepID=A0A1H9MTC0_9BACI|nr:PilZ domain-containing protein [Gracilibacillus ureilyticus]SER26665.1 PilZ domain-containing protein [Gracilibacillus ureilyticus]
MKRYRRDETFRYTFNQPSIGQFQIIQVDGENVESNPGKMEIHNISPRGMKILTGFDLMLKEKEEIIVQLSFTLVTEHTVHGKVVWQENYINKSCYYGIDLIIDDQQSDNIIEDLKHLIHKDKSNI